jgi:hypothetical protein
MNEFHPALPELKSRLGYAAGRQKELQHDAHRITERIVTEALTPVFAPHDFWITVPDFEYYVMRWSEEKGTFGYTSSIKVDVFIDRLRVEEYFTCPTLSIELLNPAGNGSQWTRPENLPWILHVSHISLAKIKELPVHCAEIFEATDVVDKMWRDMDRGLEHLKHELKIVSLIVSELDETIERIMYDPDFEY